MTAEPAGVPEPDTAADQVGTNRILTIPNVMPLVRLACIPLFLYLLFGRDNRAGAAWLLGGLGATDWIDGDVARHFNQVTRLGQLLDAFVSVAKAPQGVAGFQLAYSVEDYGIVFRPRRVEQQFVSRTFRVNPNLFKQGLEGVSFSGNPFQGNVNGQPNGAVTPPGNSGISYVTTVTNLNSIQQQARAFFAAAGVDFPTNNVAVGGAVPNNFGRPEPGQPTQKAFFLNDRTGVLYVRATVDELNMIENSLHTLNAGSAQPNGSGPPKE